MVFQGTPRAGKTTLRKNLLGDAVAKKPSSTPEPSTNLAEMCGLVIVERILVMEGEKKDELKWTVQELGDFGNTFIKCLHNEKLHQSDLTDSISREHNNFGENGNEHHNPSHSNSALNSPIQAAASVYRLPQIISAGNQTKEKSVASSLTIQQPHLSLNIDIKRLIQEATNTRDWSKVLSALQIPDQPMLIQIIDGGGQPSFQEIFPLLISGPSVSLFMFKLTDDLETPIPVEYQSKNNTEKDTWQDTYVVKDCIFHALSILASSNLDKDKNKPNVDKINPYAVKKSPKVLLVGTYKDKLTGTEDERQGAVTHCKKSILGWVRETTAFKPLIHVSSGSDIVTDISNFDSNDVRNIKKKIESTILEREPHNIPAPLLVFDFILHKYAVDRNIRKVDKTEYKDIAIQCGVESDKIDEILLYLHHIAGTLLYYPDISELNHCVITDFQLIFDSVSNIIVQYFVSSAALTLPHEKGQFQVSVLQENKCCLSIDELLALLQRRHVISPLEEGHFFMPSVLLKAEIVPSSADSSSFLLFFEHGICPVGLFCAATTRLLFKDTSLSTQWILKKSEQFRNKITFLTNYDDWYTVVFTAFSAHYEVKLDHADAPAKIKFKIYANIENIISRICKDLNIPSPIYGFYCPRKCKYANVTYEADQHPAVCKFTSEAKTMKCHYTDYSTDLTPKHKTWLPEVYIIHILPAVCTLCKRMHFIAVVLKLRIKV